MNEDNPSPRRTESPQVTSSIYDDAQDTSAFAD